VISRSVVAQAISPNAAYFGTADGSVQIVGQPILAAAGFQPALAVRTGQRAAQKAAAGKIARLRFMQTGAISKVSGIGRFRLKPLRQKLDWISVFL
jgi:hypothetical protein